MSPILPTYNTPLLLLILSNIYFIILLIVIHINVPLYPLYLYTNNNKCILSLWSIFILCILNILFFCVHIYQNPRKLHELQRVRQSPINTCLFIVVCAVSCKRNDKTQFSSQHYFVHFVPLILWKHVSSRHTRKILYKI